jgi:hypothetical protein
MTITKTFVEHQIVSGPTGSLVSDAFDSTGYTHICAWGRWQTNNTGTRELSDNKSTVFTQEPIVANSLNFAWSRIAWGKIGSPGTGHTVTLTTNAAAAWLYVVVYLLNVTTGEIAVVDTLESAVDSSPEAAWNAGDLSNTNGLTVTSICFLNPWNTATNSPGSGWTEDHEISSSFSMSRGPDTATTINVNGTNHTNTAQQAFNAIAFTESNIYRPTSDITDTGWTNSSGTDSFALIDETAYSDTDYITSPELGTGSGIIMGLGNTLAAGTYKIRVRAKYTVTSGQVKVYLLNDSNVSQGDSGWQALSASETTYTLPVTTTGSATRVKIDVQA